MQTAADHRYRLPTNGKLGSRGQLFRYDEAALVCQCLQQTENRSIQIGAVCCEMLIAKEKQAVLLRAFAGEHCLLH